MFAHNYPIPGDLAASNPSRMEIPAPGLGDDVYSHVQEIDEFHRRPVMTDKEVASLRDRLDLHEATVDGVGFELEGWIGVHSTIESESAKETTPGFARTSFTTLRSSAFTCVGSWPAIGSLGNSG